MRPFLEGTGGAWAPVREEADAKVGKGARKRNRDGLLTPSALGGQLQEKIQLTPLCTAPQVCQGECISSTCLCRTPRPLLSVTQSELELVPHVLLGTRTKT